MGQLPESRTKAGHVFEITGIDFAGPIYVRAGCSKKSQLIKSYICLFVSLSVKAVHLELVSQQTTECFLAALRRFVARRGLPSVINSDNGTSFVKADRDLAEMFNHLNDQNPSGELQDYIAKNRITWNFIPPRSPHFGGLWEAAVKSAKTHLKRVLGDAKTNYEEMSTILAEVEACLNSRPLAPISAPNEEGVEPLTPGHFLVGRPLRALPDPTPSYSDTTSPKRWKLCQTLTAHWWKRWAAEYLRTLNRTYKWQFPGQNLQIGDVELIHEWNSPKNRWPMARVSQVHPGEDGIVRVVDLQTTRNTYRRAVANVTPLVHFDGVRV